MTGSNLTSGTFYDGSNRNYSYLYDKSMYTALWIAYPLYKATCSGSNKYSGSWKSTPGFAESDQINIWSGSYGVDYGDSDIYARGHQIPDADRQYNETMVKQTYYAINSTPQIQNGFNGGIWNSLEGSIRNLVINNDKNETIYVVTGAAFRKGNETKEPTWIQPVYDSKMCPVPNYYWKAVLRVKYDTSGEVSSAQSVGFWFEHKVYSNSSFTNHTATVNDIESWTGFDLFANLPDSIEEGAENNANWNTFYNF